MKINDTLIDRAKKLAMENYETWGAKVVESMNDSELTISLQRESTLAKWVKNRKEIQSIITDRARYFDKRENYYED